MDISGADDEVARADSQYNAGHYTDAVQAYTLLIQQTPTARLYLNRSTAYARLQRWPESLADAQQALAADPTNVKAVLRVSYALQQLAQYEEAQEVLQCGLRAQPHKKQLLQALQQLHSSGRGHRLLQRAADPSMGQGLSSFSAQPQRQAHEDAISKQCASCKPGHPVHSDRLPATQEHGHSSHAGRVPASTYASRRDQDQHGGSAGIAPSTCAEACKVLGVPVGASVADIRRQWLRKVAVEHPDKGGDAEAFASLRQAYEHLTSAAPRW